MKKSATVFILAITVVLARPQAVLAQTTPAPTIVVAAEGSEADFLALIGGAIGVGAGALIGYLVGSREQWARIYEAKAP